jgi:hypothetical protein
VLVHVEDCPGRFGWLRALRAHTKAPHNAESLWEMWRALDRPGRARTVGSAVTLARLMLMTNTGRAPAATMGSRGQPVAKASTCTVAWMRPRGILVSSWSY